MTFAAHADDFDAVHPMWWHIGGSATAFARIYGEGEPLVTSNTTAGGKRTKLIPTIAGADGSDPGIIKAMLVDPSAEAAHIAAIVSLVQSKHYDGIDLDYEHIDASYRGAFSKFVADLAKALHAAGATLSLAIDGATAPGEGGVYDYDALSAAADHLHVMAYDYHFLGSHPGPVSPLGWVKKIAAYAGSFGPRATKFILGLPNYGIAGADASVTNWFGDSMTSIQQAGGSYATTTSHMATATSCPFTNGLLVDPGRAPNAYTSQGHLFFDDLASMEEKVAAAEAAGLGGITYWTIGGEPDRPGPNTFFQMVRAHFPR
jgi:spore germination protein YaaH